MYYQYIALNKFTLKAKTEKQSTTYMYVYRYSKNKAKVVDILYDYTSILKLVHFIVSFKKW